MASAAPTIAQKDVPGDERESFKLEVRLTDVREQIRRDERNIVRHAYWSERLQCSFDPEIDALYKEIESLEIEARALAKAARLQRKSERLHDLAMGALERING